MQQNKIVFIQQRPNRGGAQVALGRLMSAPEMRALRPAVILGSEGWLADDLRQQGVDVVVTAVPSVRSLGAKLWGIGSFVRKMVGRFPGPPLAVIANNHQEAILAARLARALRTKSAVILRDPYITRDTLERYGWDEPDHTLAVGSELEQLATAVNASIPVTHLYDGIGEEDFDEPKPKPVEFPQAALVIGGPIARKGWREWMRAIEIAGQKEPALRAIRFDFTGAAPAGVTETEQFRFVGHRPDFKSRVRSYDLVVNPTQAETFGLAAVETLAAGVPLLSTQTGVIGNEVWLAPEMTMERSPERMAERISSLYQGWATANPMIAESQKSIRKFTPSSSAATVLGCVARMQRGE